MPIGQESRVSDPNEPPWKDMLHEPAKELAGAYRHLALLVAVSVVFPLEGDMVAIDCQQTMIADRDAVRVSPEVPKHLWRASHGRLCVDHPILSIQGMDKGLEPRSVPQVRAGAEKLQLLLAICPPQRLDKFASEHTAEHLDWQEEGVQWADPCLAIWRNPPAGTMQCT